MQRDQFEGCVFGCAVGDALGAPYEGLHGSIITKLMGISEPVKLKFGHFDGYPMGQFTDDTQLTIASLEALVQSEEWDIQGIAENLGELWKTAKVIGPGGACMLAGDRYNNTRNWQDCGAPIGQAGNGTAMRMAFLGLICGSQEQLIERGLQLARLTHKDARSCIGGILVAEATRLLASKQIMMGQQLKSDSINELLVSLCECTSSIVSLMAEQQSDFQKAGDLFSQSLTELFSHDEALSHDVEYAAVAKQILTLSHDPNQQTNAITPYIVPTVLASLWAIVHFSNNWSEAVATVLSLGGDVDTTAAIVGSILGAKLGVQAIPGALRQTVQRQANLKFLSHRLWQLRPKLLED